MTITEIRTARKNTNTKLKMRAEEEYRIANELKSNTVGGRSYISGHGCSTPLLLVEKVASCAQNLIQPNSTRSIPLEIKKERERKKSSRHIDSFGTRHPIVFYFDVLSSFSNYFKFNNCIKLS